MTHYLNVTCEVAVSEGVKITFKEYVEVSLDCLVCQRAHRTVVLFKDASKSKCLKTKHAYPGGVAEISLVRGKSADPGNQVYGVVYQIFYEFEPFKDAKYSARPVSSKITWGRVHFDVQCLCGRMERNSIQNNLVRPWTNRCQCGHALYTETVEMPRFVT